jgi:hypothetical protein
MGINDQAEADVQETGLDDEQIDTGRNEDSTDDSGGDQSENEPSFDDVTDIESLNRKMEELEAADMPEQNPGNDDEEDEDAASEEDESDKADDASQDEEAEEAEDEEAKEDESDDSSDDDSSDESDDEEESGDKKPKSKRYRVRSEDPVELRALELKARNRDMSLKEAMEKAEAELGSNTDKSGENADESGSDSDLPSTVDATEAEIEKLIAERKTALREDLDFEKADELDAEIRKLDRHVADLKVKDFQNQAQQQQGNVEKKEAAKAKAVELYDFVTQDGPEVERMEEIDAQLREANDPQVDDPEYPLRLAQMVAKEMGIAPKGKRVKKPDQATPGQPPKKKSPVQPASASARTQAPPSPQGQLDEKIDAIKSPHDLEEFIESLGSAAS